MKGKLQFYRYKCIDNSGFVGLNDSCHSLPRQREAKYSLSTLSAGQLRPANFICELCYKFFEHLPVDYRGA